MNSRSRLGLLACSMLAMTPVQATTTFFDFGATGFGVAGGDAYNALGMSVNGIGVTVDAVLIDNDDAGNILNVTTISGPNLGVYVSGGANNIGVRHSDGDGDHIDGGTPGDISDPDEGLRLVFDRAVTLGGINFDSWNNLFDDFNLAVDGVELVTEYWSGRVPGSPFVGDVTSDEDHYRFFNVSGSEFIFWADDDNDAFRIDDLFLIPNPGVLALFGMGLLGWRLARR